MSNPNPQITRHYAAMSSPRGGEVAIVAMLGALETYAATHRARYESSIGEDYVLGPQFAAMCAGFRGLLNGELGRLDAGALDSRIMRLALENDLNIGDG